MPSPLTLPVRYMRHQPPIGAPIRRAHSLVRGRVSFGVCNAGAGATVLDSAGQATGTLSNGVTWGASPYGRALHFPGGSTQYVELADTPDMAFTGDITLEVMVRTPTAFPGYAQTIIEKGGDVATGAGWGASLSYSGGANNQPTMRVVISGGEYEVNGPTASPNTWQHIVGVRQETSLYVTVNGQTTGPGTIPSGPLRYVANSYVGGDPKYNSFYFTGWISWWSITNRALSPAEVRSLFLAPYQMF